MSENFVAGYPGDYVMECVHCEERFEAVRSTARYCSGKCRQASLREGKQREKQRQQIKALAISMTDRWCSSFDYDVLRYVYRRIGNYLSYHGQLSENDENKNEVGVSK